MTSPKFASTFYLLSLALVLEAVVGLDPISHSCSNPIRNNKSKFETNLELVLKYLNTSTPIKGFSLVSRDNVQGLAHCKANIASSNCQTCINLAISDIRHMCKSESTAVIWYDDCLLKYSTNYFFGKIDFRNYYVAFNLKSASRPERFNAERNKFLEQLINEASLGHNFAATGETKIDKYDKLFGFAQCTNDLRTGNDCKKCLKFALKLILAKADGKIGGQAATGSCYIRYEMRPF